MPQCVGIDGGGYVVAVAESFPQCSEFALVEPSHLERLTFFADLSVMLEPTSADAWGFYAATLLVFIAAFGARQLARLILNR
jgi:hypothetical protein